MKRLSLMTMLLLLMVTHVYAQPAQDWIEGRLEIVADDPAGLRYALRTNEGTVELKLDASWGPLQDYWKGLKSGQRKRVRGWRQGNVLLLASPYAIEQLQVGPSAAPDVLPDTTGTQTVLLILVRFSNPVVLPYTPAAGLAKMQGNIDAFIQEASYGQTSLDVTVTDWLPIALTNVACDPFALADQADTAAAGAGFTLTNYMRHVYGFPFVGSCPWNGLASVGGAPTRLWLNGVFSDQTAVHEFGHNFGLFHSHSLVCTPAIVTWPCPVDDLGDWLDVLGRTIVGPSGSRELGHYNPSQKDRLGWLDGRVTEVLSSGVYQLGAYADDVLEPKALRLPHPTITSPEAAYYLHHRAAVGFDSYLSAFPDITNGIVAHLTDLQDETTSFVLDAHPATPSFSDAAFLGAELFSDPWSSLRWFVVQAGSGTAEVAVNWPGHVISIGLVTNQAVYHAGDLLALTATVTIGTQPAQYGWVAWSAIIPGYGWFDLGASPALPQDGVGTFSAVVPGGLPAGAYTLIATAGWWDQIASSSQDITILP